MANTSLEEKERIRRFGAYRISEHWVLIFSFGLLLVTGLAQKFYTVPVSQWVIIVLGGITQTRLVHHTAGVVFLLLAFSHIIVNCAGILSRKLTADMIITVKDFTDAIHNVKYYLGIEDRPAESDRYNYKQKFVYWFVLLGSLQMIATGLVLWFPVATAKVFPGQIIPISKVMHSNEALLMFLIIVIWHIYDSIFNPTVFPLDKSIFTGYIVKSRGEEGPPRDVVTTDAEAEDGLPADEL